MPDLESRISQNKPVVMAGAIIGLGVSAYAFGNVYVSANKLDTQAQEFFKQGRAVDAYHFKHDAMCTYHMAYSLSGAWLAVALLCATAWKYLAGK